MSWKIYPMFENVVLQADIISDRHDFHSQSRLKLATKLVKLGFKLFPIKGQKSKSRHGRKEKRQCFNLHTKMYNSPSLIKITLIFIDGNQILSNMAAILVNIEYRIRMKRRLSFFFRI
jgi:hypothetical protein